MPPAFWNTTRTGTSISRDIGTRLRYRACILNLFELIHQNSRTLHNITNHMGIITLQSNTNPGTRPLRLQLDIFQNLSKHIIQFSLLSRSHLGTRSSQTSRNCLKRLVHIDFRLLRWRHSLNTASSNVGAFRTACHKLHDDNGLLILYCILEHLDSHCMLTILAQFCFQLTLQSLECRPLRHYVLRLTMQLTNVILHNWYRISLQL